jgi:hypothetical protein
MAGPRNWRQFFVRVRKVARFEGWEGFCRRSLAAAGYRSLAWCVCPLDAIVLSASGEPQLDVEELTPPDLASYLTFRHGATRRQVSERLRAGHRCFFARIDGRVVSAAWVATGQGRLRREISLAPEEEGVAPGAHLGRRNSKLARHQL